MIVGYVRQAICRFEWVRAECLHPVQGGTPALLSAATALVAMAILPYSTTAAWTLAVGSIAWHVGFSLWHTGTLWQGGRRATDTLPTVYLPTVDGNFTSAAVLGALGRPDWGWLFPGAGLFSWVALESLVIQRLWHPTAVPSRQRPLSGIQLAPPAVCAMASLALSPGRLEPWILMLSGYGLFQLLLGLRLGSWLRAQPFVPAYWAYTFGVDATAVATLKLVRSGAGSAQLLALPVFIGTDLLIRYLVICALHLFTGGRVSKRPVA
nr:dicarboxylate transporter/tellurite-resistance protein TehA [Burkholderia multivorans]